MLPEKDVGLSRESFDVFPKPKTQPMQKRTDNNFEVVKVAQSL